MISWRVSLSKRWSARRRCLAVLDFITTWGHRGLPKWRRSKKGVEWWDNFSWESIKGQLSVLHLGGDWLKLPQALPYMCLALPGPCAVVAPALPVDKPQARPCQPMRSGRQGERRRCRHAWPHTPPSQLAGWLGLPECVGAVGALCLGCALRLSGGLSGRGVCRLPGVLSSLWALADPQLLPAACK